MTKQLRLGLVLLFSTMAAYATNHTSVDSLRNAMNEVVGSIKAYEDYYRQNPEVLKSIIRPVMETHFDMHRIVRWSIGKRWRNMNSKQQGRFTAAFKNLLLNTYSAVLMQGLDKEIEWRQVRENRNPEGEVVSAVVEAKTTTTSGSVVEIRFYLKQNPKYYEGIKVYDVQVNGASLVTNYRGSFSQIIQREGVESFLQQLEAKSD